MNGSARCADCDLLTSDYEFISGKYYCDDHAPAARKQRSILANSKAIAEAAERDWDSPIPLMTLRNFHAAASPTIILTLLERLATAEKQIADALSLVDLIDGANFDILNGRPELDAIEEIQLAIRKLRAALTVQDKEKQ